MTGIGGLPKLFYIHRSAQRCLEILDALSGRGRRGSDRILEQLGSPGRKGAGHAELGAGHVSNRPTLGKCHPSAPVGAAPRFTSARLPSMKAEFAAPSNPEKHSILRLGRRGAGPPTRAVVPGLRRSIGL